MSDASAPMTAISLVQYLVGCLRGNRPDLDIKVHLYGQSGADGYLGRLVFLVRETPGYAPESVVQYATLAVSSRLPVGISAEVFPWDDAMEYRLAVGGQAPKRTLEFPAKGGS